MSVRDWDERWTDVTSRVDRSIKLSLIPFRRKYMHDLCFLQDSHSLKEGQTSASLYRTVEGWPHVTTPLLCTIGVEIRTLDGIKLLQIFYLSLSALQYKSM